MLRVRRGQGPLQRVNMKSIIQKRPARFFSVKSLPSWSMKAKEPAEPYSGRGADARGEASRKRREKILLMNRPYFLFLYGPVRLRQCSAKPLFTQSRAAGVLPTS